MSNQNGLRDSLNAHFKNSIDFQRFDLTEKKFWKKKNPTSISVLGFLFFYLIFKKIIKSKWVVRQFKSEFQKLVKSWDSILRICSNFAIKRLSPHCAVSTALRTCPALFPWEENSSEWFISVRHPLGTAQIEDKPYYAHWLKRGRIS